MNGQIERAMEPCYYIEVEIFEQEKEQIFFKNWLYNECYHCLGVHQQYLGKIL